MKSFTAPTQAEPSDQQSKLLLKLVKDLELRVTALEDLAIMQQEQIQNQQASIQTLIFQQETTEYTTQVLRQDVNYLIPLVNQVETLEDLTSRLITDTENLGEQLQYIDNRTNDLQSTQTLQAQTIQQHTGNIATLGSQLATMQTSQDQLEASQGQLQQVLGTNLAVIASYSVIQIGKLGAAFSYFSTEIVDRFGNQNTNLTKYYSYPSGGRYIDPDLESNSYDLMQNDILMQSIRRSFFSSNITTSNAFNFQLQLYQGFTPYVFRFCNIPGTYDWKIANTPYLTSGNVLITPYFP